MKRDFARGVSYCSYFAKKQLFFVAFFLFFALRIYSQSVESSCNKQKIVPFVRTEYFFKNNEYSPKYGRGYTLPGYRIIGTISYSNHTLLSKVKFTLGFSLRHLLGATVGVGGTWFEELKDFKEAFPHNFSPLISPLFSIDLAFTPEFTLYLGNYDTTLYPHFLPYPLYNKELRFLAPPEQGLRLYLNQQYHKGDLWIDWQRFTYPRATHQELFTAGLSWQTLYPLNDKFSLGGALHTTASHRGGEINQMKEDDIVRTYLASMVGLSAQYKRKDIVKERDSLTISSSLYGAYSAIGQDNFPKGWGAYLTTSISYNALTLENNLWYGHNFNASMGGPFTNSLPRWNNNILASQISFWHIAPRWDILKYPFLTLSLEGDFWWHFFPLYESGKRYSHAMTLYLCYTPSF